MAGTGARSGRSPERPSDKLNAVGRQYERWSSRLARTKPATASRRSSSISRIPTHLGSFVPTQAPHYWPLSVNAVTLRWWTIPRQHQSPVPVRPWSSVLPPAPANLSRR
jgi:hypothetical protein